MEKKIWEIPGEEWRKSSFRTHDLVEFLRKDTGRDRETIYKHLGKVGSFNDAVGVNLAPRSLVGLGEISRRPSTYDMARFLSEGSGTDSSGRKVGRMSFEDAYMNLTTIKATPYQAPSLKILSSGGLTLY